MAKDKGKKDKGKKAADPRIPTKGEIRDQMLAVFMAQKVGLVPADAVFVTCHSLIAGLGARLAEDQDNLGLDVMVRTMAVMIGAMTSSNTKVRDRLNTVVLDLAHFYADQVENPDVKKEDKKKTHNPSNN